MALTRRSKSKCRLMTHLAKPLRVATLLLAASSTNSVTAQEDGLFSKSFPDGSKVRLTSSTITEFRSRPRSANPDAPEKEIYSDREWKLVTYTLLLKRPTVNKEEMLWREDVEISVADRKMYDIFGGFAVNDMFLSRDRAHVLYANGGFVAVVNLTRSEDGDWFGPSPTELVRSTDVYPVSKWIFMPTAKPQIAIDMIVHGKICTWIWNLKGGRWVLNKKSSWRPTL